MSVEDKALRQYKNLVYRQYLSMVAGKCNLDLRFCHDAAPCTDGKVVIIPEDCLNDEKRDELITYVLHEAGHARYTSFSAVQKLKPYELELCNAVEDVRIEARMCRLYGGAKGYFAKSFAKMLPEFLRNMKKNLGKMNLLGKYCSFVFAEAEAYAYEHMYDVSKYRGISEKALEKEFPDPQAFQMLVAEARTALQGVPLLKSTEDTIALVKRLIAILERYAPQAKSSINNQSSTPDQKEGGSEAKNTESASSKKSRKTRKSASSQEQGNGSANSIPQPQSFEESMLQQQQELENSSTKLNPLDRGQSLKVQDHPGASKCGRGHPHQVRAEDPEFPKDPQSTKIGVDLVRLARRESSQVATALRSFIEAKAETSIDYVSSGSKVKTSRLYRVPTGSFKVFTRSSEDPEASNTAVCILLDTSGSMGCGASITKADHDSPMCRATRATLALCLALRNLAGTENVTTSVIGFPGSLIDREAQNAVQPSDVRKNPYAQYLLHHGETLTQERAMHFAHFDAFGPTPLNEALEAATVDLMGCADVTRRVVFVITDGTAVINEALLETLRKQGIEVYGLSVESRTEDLEEAFGKDHVEECESQALTKALVSLARKALV